MKTIFTLSALALVAVSGITVAAPQTDSSPMLLAAASQYPNQGKVLDVIDTNPMYTYLQVSTNKGPVWVAATKTKVQKGATVGFGNGAVMSNFYSKTMNKTFDTLIMVDKVEVLKK